MAFTSISVEEILETLSKKEKEEVSRDDFKIPLQLYLKGFNKGEFINNRQMFIDKIR